MKGKLYVVATPIGNLGDITVRALEVLKTVDVIACEDTRHTLALLNKYEIKKPLVSYYKHKEIEGCVKIKNLLEEGKNVALVSDAGMPCISDPGSALVRALREENYQYTIVPGACAVVSAVALSGVEGGFAFLGFLPEKKKDVEKILSQYKIVDTNLVIYVAPHDVTNTIKTLYEVLGDRKVYVIKEITKIYESVIVGNLSDVVIDNPKGEYVLVLDRPIIKKEEVTDEILIKEFNKKIADGMDKKTAIKAVADRYEISKNYVYKLTIN